MGADVLASQIILPAAPADGFADIGTGRRLRADVVIVGSGPGGASVARVLAEAGKKVVIVEEGPARSMFKREQGHTAQVHMQEGGAIVSRGNAYMGLAAGRGVGGSTLINSALSFRTPDSVLRRWATQLDDPLWGPGYMGPILDEVSRLSGVARTPERVAGKNNLLIARGIKAMGWEGGLAPRSTPGCTGCGVCNFGCPTNGKASVNTTFLPRAVTAGALIQAEARVTEVLLDSTNTYAIGVRAVAVDPLTGQTGGELIVEAELVVLSAGGIGTPRLLWGCGLGERLGPATGEGLLVHPGNAVLGVCDEEIHMWRGATQGAYFHHPELPGVLPHTFSAPPEVCLLATGLVGDRLQEGIALLPRLAGMVVMVSDHGHGRVRAKPDGRADVQYTFADDDVVRIKRGMVESARVLLAGGARELIVPVHGVPRTTSAEALGVALADVPISDFSLYAAHPMSTCQMGTDPERSVVDPLGRAHKIKGLRISDTSIFPSSLGVNPQLTTMAVGTALARRWLS